MSEEQVAETMPPEEAEMIEGEVVETAVSTEQSASSTTAAQPTCEELLAAAQEEAAKNLDGWMRSQAEFSNARKRMDKQRIEIQVRASHRYGDTTAASD